MIHPLQGKKIVITRAEHQAEAMAQVIRDRGGTPYLFPVIKTKRLDALASFTHTMKQFLSYDGLIFTSANGVQHFFQYIDELKLNFDDQQINKHLNKISYIAIGKKTKQALEGYGYLPSVVPYRNDQEGVVEAVLNYFSTGTKFLFPCGNLARRVIVEELNKAGMVVQPLVVYETVQGTPDIEAFLQQLKHNKIDVLTFTSSSTVNFFKSLLEGTSWRKHMEGVTIASIGSLTSIALDQNDLTVQVEAKETTIENLISELESYFMYRGEN